MGSQIINLWEVANYSNWLGGLDRDRILAIKDFQSCGCTN